MGENVELLTLIWPLSHIFITVLFLIHFIPNLQLIRSSKWLLTISDVQSNTHQIITMYLVLQCCSSGGAGGVASLCVLQTLPLRRKKMNHLAGGP